MNDNIKKGIIAICDILLYIIVFVLLQGVTVMLCNQILPFDDATKLIIGQAISAIATILIFVLLRWTRVGMKVKTRNPWSLTVWISLFTLCTLIPTTWIMEAAGMSEMPEEYTKLFEQILSSPIGYVTVALIVPVAEEVVFRGAILDRLLAWLGNDRRWIAISISAFIFGLAHGNQAQGLHAFAFGLLLGWLFYKTGSIIPGLVFHWVNNTAAVVLSFITDTDSDATLIEIFGGNATLLYSVLAASIVIGIPAFYKIIKSL